MAKTNDNSKKEKHTAFTELCRYADEYHLIVELEKPFEEFDQIFLKLIDADGNQVNSIILSDISVLDKESAALLNELSSTKH